MIVAGIDPSLTNTGLAILHTGAPYRLHSIGYPGHHGATYDERSQRIVAQTRAVMNWLTDLGTKTPQWVTDATPPTIDLAVIEGPAYAQNLPSNHDRAALWWGLYSALRAKNIPVAVITPTARSSWATGHGRAPKATVLTAVRAWWPNIRINNHDIADALALATIGAAHAGDPLPFQLKDRHHNTLAAITWPVMA